MQSGNEDEKTEKKKEKSVKSIPPVNLIQDKEKPPPPKLDKINFSLDVDKPKREVEEK
jgi:hypothetical protein